MNKIAHNYLGRHADAFGCDCKNEGMLCASDSLLVTLLVTIAVQADYGE